jgi:hypothetical protein
MGVFPTYEEFVAEVRGLNGTDLVKEVTAFGKSVRFEDLYVVTLSDNIQTRTKNGVLVLGAVNSEPVPARFILYTIKRMLQEYATDDDVALILKTTELHFIPIVNMDGYKALSVGYAKTQDWTSFHPKSFGALNSCTTSAEMSGVNLDRNFPHDWGLDDVGSSSDTCSEDYRGTKFFSEPETKRVDDWSILNPFQLGISYHSYGKEYLYPFSGDATEPLDSVDRKIYDMLQPMVPSDYAYGRYTTIRSTPSNGSALDYLLKPDTTALAAYLASTHFPTLDEITETDTKNYDTFIKLCKAVAFSLEVSLVETHDELCDVLHPCEIEGAYSTMILTYNVTNTALGTTQPLELNLFLDYSFDVPDYTFKLARAGKYEGKENRDGAIGFA